MTSRREFLATAGMLAGVAAAAQPGKIPVIDCHVHAGHASNLTDPWTTIADPAEILHRMDQAGVDKACIFPISNPTYEAANQEIAAICRKYPGRFIGFAKHDSNTEKGRIRQMMLRECRELGLRGLKMHAPGPSPEVLEVATELGIPILYHPARVARFEEAAKANPQVDMILAHLGSDMSMDYREHLAAIECARQYPNVYLDTSTVVITRYLEKAIADLPPEKLVYGADEPEVDTRLEIAKIRILKLPKPKEELILGGNMTRLLAKYKGGQA